MLTFTATDTEGRKILLPAVLSATVHMDEEVPADDLYAVFPDISCAELCGISVYDGDRVAFRGVVDEEEHIVSPSGRYLRISARSMAAHLLDNEALPRGYDHPGARMIYERHAKEYGIAAGDLDDATCFGELNIVKGMSQWSVIKAFCGACYSSTPRVSADGTLYLKGIPRRDRVIFGERGIAYTELTDSIRRCEEISRVNVKIGAEDGYTCPVENSDALRRGIRRERYLNAMLNGKAVRGADVMLEKSRERARVLTLKCPGRYLELLGADAAVEGGSSELKEGLCVSAATFHTDSKGEVTTVKLRRRMDRCGSPAM